MSTIRFFERQSLFQTIEIIRRCGEKLPPIKADQFHLQQVLMSIVINKESV